MNRTSSRDQAVSARTGAVLRGQTCAPLAAFVAIVGLFAPFAATAQQADGERLFRQRCGACHSMDAGQNRAGPHLPGVIGRTADSIDGARYSDAMRDPGNRRPQQPGAA